MSDECIFCKIVRKEIPSLRVYEDSDCVAMLDVKPLAPGHTVFIPKKHIALFEELDDDMMQKIFVGVKKSISMIKNSALRPQAFTIGINDGKAAGQFVPHLHIHIIPRFDGDKGGSVHTIVNNPPHEDLKSVHEKILAEKQHEEPLPERTPEKSVEEIVKKEESLEARIKRLEREMGL